MKIRTTHTLTPRDQNALAHHLGVDTVTEASAKEWAQQAILAELQRAAQAFERSTK